MFLHIKIIIFLSILKNKTIIQFQIFVGVYHIQMFSLLKVLAYRCLSPNYRENIKYEILAYILHLTINQVY